MQVLKDEIRHKILLEAELLFLQKGYDRTTLQMIADKVNISKSNFYHYFRSKEEMFYVLTDGAADGLKKLILRLREKRFDPSTGQREYQFLLTEEFVSLLTAEKYGMLLIMEQAKGTRYEGLRSSLIDMLAAKTAPMLADEDNSMLLAQIMARNLIDGMVLVLKSRVRPREIRTNLNRLVEYHTKGIDALLK